MPIVGLSPTWWVKTGLGSLPTCNTHWNAKAIHETIVTNQSFTTSPAWIPLFSSLNNQMLDITNENSFAFCRMLVPGFIQRSIMSMHGNTLSSGFTIHLARDGPVAGGGVGNGTPIQENLIFNVLDITDPEFNAVIKFPTGIGPIPDDIMVPLFSGHSYGFLVQTPDDVIPTGTTRFNIMTSVYYGGAGS